MEMNAWALIKFQNLETSLLSQRPTQKWVLIKTTEKINNHIKLTHHKQR
jgi:hypothetical protein